MQNTLFLSLFLGLFLKDFRIFTLFFELLKINYNFPK